ncbi:unnamed protein product [Toxocara canis]|uniref:Transposase n=1 Tax=Toxocara canis TaxID=6265 RepID=A0A183V4H4_TOXCA|nr:unnamed protein product [Toxocara canis]
MYRYGFGLIVGNGFEDSRDLGSSGLKRSSGTEWKRCAFLLYTLKISFTYLELYKGFDQVAEWLRGWTANPLGFPRVSSNVILIAAHFAREWQNES